jgi:hypothetical protein
MLSSLTCPQSSLKLLPLQEPIVSTFSSQSQTLILTIDRGYVMTLEQTRAIYCMVAKAQIELSDAEFQLETINATGESRAVVEAIVSDIVADCSLRRGSIRSWNDLMRFLGWLDRVADLRIREFCQYSAGELRDAGLGVNELRRVIALNKLEALTSVLGGVKTPITIDRRSHWKGGLLTICISMHTL